MIKTIIFDIGKVITNTDFQSRYTNFANAVGINPQSVIDYHANNLDELLLGNISFEKFASDLKIDMDYDEVKSLWVQESITTTEVNKELLNLIDKLRSSYTIQTLTNVSELRSLTDEALGIYKYFDRIHLSYLQHLIKPDNRFYQLALDAANANPKEAIFIDDNEKFIAPAQKIGIHGIVFHDNKQLKSELINLGITI